MVTVLLCHLLLVLLLDLEAGDLGQQYVLCLTSSQPYPGAELCAQGSSALSRCALTTRAVPAWLEEFSFIVGFPAPETGGTGQSPPNVTLLTGQLSLHCPLPSYKGVYSIESQNHCYWKRPPGSSSSTCA